MKGEFKEVVITGIRASAQAGSDIKQQAVGIVDALSAQDIATFPGGSLGEAVQRIPGVTVTRTASSALIASAELLIGRPSAIAVRGFGG
jgi:outer membrane receptor protein involved in Fe transport